MSLRAVHIVFISASILLAIGFSGWSFRNYFSPDGVRSDLIFGLASAVAAVALLIYGKYFLKKLRNISYL